MRRILATDDDALSQTTAALDAGELVVVPGDVCYLLAGDALDDAAVESIFLAKSRGSDRGLTVLVGGFEDVHHVAYGGPAARALGDEHWPGPTSLALRARPWLPDAVTGGDATVRVSVPRQEFTRALAKRFGPLAVAAARHSGGPAPLAVGAALAAPLAVDAGALPGGEAKVIRDVGIAPE